MADPYPPLLPWKITGLLLLLLAWVTGWRTAWYPFAADPVVQGQEQTWDRSAGVLFLGNSRMGFSLERGGKAAEVMARAGHPGVRTLVVARPLLDFVHLDAIWPESPALRLFHPALVVVQVDLFFPISPAEHRGAAQRLRDFALDGPAWEAGQRYLDHLSWAQWIAVEVPFPEPVLAELDAAWARRRQEAYDRLRKRDIELILPTEAWPGSLYAEDGIHFNPAGEARLRRWLGEQLAPRADL